jgi:hypothetical protein
MQKSDLGVFFKVWFTLGIYAAVWLFQAFAFVNDYSDAPVYPMRRLRLTALGYGAGVAVMFLALLLVDPGAGGPSAASFAALFYGLWALAVVGVALLGYGVYDVAVRLRAIERAMGVGRTVSPPLALALFFAYLIAFPYLQAHINIVCRASR